MDIATVTFIVLAVQAVIYGLMLWQMIKTANATKIAADAAKKAADSVVITERAIVLIQSVEVNMRAGSNIELTAIVIFTLKNFGRTIARNVELTGKLFVTGLGELAVEKLPPTTIAPDGSNSWITPSINHLIGDDVTLALISQVGLGGTSLETKLEYAINVTYRDAFREYRYNCVGRYEPNLKKFLITGSTSD